MEFLGEQGSTSRAAGGACFHGGGRSRAEAREAVVVSLDWGFHAPLRFVRPELELAEPVWSMRGRRTVLRGEPHRVYLVLEPENQVFYLGARLLAAVEALPPGAAVVRVHSDRLGVPAFRSIRFAAPHDLVYGDEVEVRFK